jgi:hypothetical protein
VFVSPGVIHSSEESLSSVWWLTWIQNNFQALAGKIGSAFVNGSHGNPEVILLASEIWRRSRHILDASKMALAVSSQVCRDRRAGGLLQLSRANDVGKIAWPVVGDDHARDATLGSKMRGGHVGEWG